MKKNLVALLLVTGLFSLLVSCLLSSCEEVNISTDPSNSEIHQSESLLGNISNEIEDIIPLTINLKVGELYDITIEEDIEVVLSNDNVFYNETHKDLIALEEGNTIVEVSLKKNPNINMLINITVKGIPLHHYPLHRYSKEIYMTVGETIYLNNIDIGGMNYYVHNIINPCIEVNTFWEKTEHNTTKKTMKIVGLEEGNSLINFYDHTYHTFENSYQIDTIKVFVNEKDTEYTNQQFYESYSFDSAFTADYFSLGDYEFINTKSRLLEVLNYCTYMNSEKIKIPYELLLLDYSKYTILMINRKYSSLYSASKYYGFKVEDEKLYINEKIYGLKFGFYDDSILDMLIISNDFIPQNIEASNYQLNVRTIDRIEFEPGA